MSNIPEFISERDRYVWMLAESIENKRIAMLEFTSSAMMWAEIGDECAVQGALEMIFELSSQIATISKAAIERMSK